MPTRESLNPMFELQAAVIGTGFIGPVHIEGLQRAGVRVRGVLGSSLEKSKAVATQYGIECAYASLAELLADANVDVVHITSPNRFHHAQTLACLAAGKHVLCEKPLAMNSGESAELVAAARRSGLHTAVNYNVRYYPLCIEARQRVRSGECGRIFHVSGSYVQDWLHQSTDFNWRVLASEGGELRAIADIGTHWLDLVQSITGLSIESVCADLQTVHPVRQVFQGSRETFTVARDPDPSQYRDQAIDTEDFGSVLLRFSHGVRGVMHVSQVTAGHKNSIRWEIASSQQSLAWDSRNAEGLWIGHRDQANQVLPRDPSLLQPVARAHAQYPGGHAEGFPDTFKQLFRAFYTQIETGQSGGLLEAPSFEDGHREIMVCEAILASARAGAWVHISGS
ncbi:MAG: Gfo/Idh/MocA family protein [Pirellula sp.]